MSAFLFAPFFVFFFGSFSSRKTSLGKANACHILLVAAETFSKTNTKSVRLNAKMG
jgi:hypothetical protein